MFAIFWRLSHVWQTHYQDLCVDRIPEILCSSHSDNSSKITLLAIQLACVSIYFMTIMRHIQGKWFDQLIPKIHTSVAESIKHPQVIVPWEMHRVGLLTGISVTSKILSQNVILTDLCHLIWIHAGNRNQLNPKESLWFKVSYSLFRLSITWSIPCLM